MGRSLADRKDELMTKSRSRPESSSESETADLSPAQTDALRESIRCSLVGEPERGDGGMEIYLVEIQSAIRMYLDPTAAQPSEQPSEQPNELESEWLARELDAVMQSACSLARVLEDLSGALRSRFVETTELDVESLDSLLHLSRLVESQAGAVQQRRGPGKALSFAATAQDPEIEFVERLSLVWTQHTGERIRRDRESASPWARFVEVACSIAGIASGSAHQLRVRLYDSASLDESAEILATIPDL